MPFLLTRGFSGFLSLPLLPNAPPLVSFKKIRSDTFSVYILMVTVHGSSESTFYFSWSRKGSYGIAGWEGGRG